VLHVVEGLKKPDAVVAAEILLVGFFLGKAVMGGEFADADHDIVQNIPCFRGHGYRPLLILVYHMMSGDATRKYLKAQTVQGLKRLAWARTKPILSSWGRDFPIAFLGDIWHNKPIVPRTNI